MPDKIGNITVPEIVASGTFPIVPEYPYGRASHPDVAIHQFGSGNAKIEQRFLLGTGAQRFTVRQDVAEGLRPHRAPELLGVEVRAVRRVHLQRAERQRRRDDGDTPAASPTNRSPGRWSRMGVHSASRWSRSRRRTADVHAQLDGDPVPLRRAQGRPCCRRCSR